MASKMKMEPSCATEELLRTTVQSVLGNQSNVLHLAPFLPLLLTLLLANGCATPALWNDGNLEACKEPAGNPNLRLFDATRRNDVLVVYDEYSERNDKVHTQAYWLGKNQARMDQQHAPHFASTKLMDDLPAVPVFTGSTPGVTNTAPPLYAVMGTNQQSFTLYARGHPMGSHDLPVYNDGWGHVIKAGLTPVAVTADITIIGGVVGCWCAAALGQSGTSISVH
jgi:hypothetical protein